MDFQLETFKYSIKKKNKFKELKAATKKEFLSLKGKKCLDIGCGNGSISYNLRKIGGEWHSIDSNKECVNITKKLVKKNVSQQNAVKTKFKKNSFDLIIALDIIEHIKDDIAFIKEINRIIRKGGTFILTTPRIGKRMPLNKIKDVIGLTPDKYGHVVAGYTKKGLTKKLLENGFKTKRTTTYSKFFTEIIELIINLYYLKKKNKKAKGYNAYVSPANEKDLKEIGNAFKIYKIIYPLLLIFSFLDYLNPFRGYGLLVISKKIDN